MRVLEFRKPWRIDGDIKFEPNVKYLVKGETLGSYSLGKYKISKSREGIDYKIKEVVTGW